MGVGTLRTVESKRGENDLTAGDVACWLVDTDVLGGEMDDGLHCYLVCEQKL